MSQDSTPNVIRGIIRSLACTLTPRQQAEMGKQLAQKGSEITEVEAEKAAYNAQLAARVKGLKAEQSRLENILISGSEVKPVECEARLHTPTQGHKTIYRLDTGAEIETSPMTQAEMQGSFRFDEEQEDDPEEASQEDTNVEDQPDDGDESEDEETEAPQEEADAVPEPAYPSPDGDGLYSFDDPAAQGVKERLGVSRIAFFLIEVGPNQIHWGWQLKLGAQKLQQSFLGANPHCESSKTAIRKGAADLKVALDAAAEKAGVNDTPVVVKFTDWVNTLSMNA